MARQFKMGLASNRLDVEVTLRRKVRPYIEAWFDDKKREGETLSRFLSRKLARIALEERAKDIAKEIRKESENTAMQQGQALKDLKNQSASAMKSLDED